MPITTSSGQTYDDETIKRFFSVPRSEEDIASQSAGLGLNAGQITEAMTIGRGTPQTEANVNSWVADKPNGYAWGGDGGLIKAPASTPAPAPTAAPAPAPAAPAPKAPAPAPDYSPASPAASPAQPATAPAVAPVQTVESRIAGIISQNSPLMQQARADSLGQMNERGLINSSMAVTAGNAAVYRAAMPIAQADAAAQNEFTRMDKAQGFDLAKMDQGAALALTQLNAQQQNDVVKMGLNQGYTLQNMTTAQVNDMAKLTTSITADVAKYTASESGALTRLGMDSATKKDLAGIEAGYKTLMQTSASSGELYKQMVTNMTTIMTNKDMGAEAKATAIRNQVTALNNGLAMFGKIGNLDLANLLTFDAPATGDAAAPAPPPPGLISAPVNPDLQNSGGAV